MAKLCSEQTCTGCSACYNVCPKNAISMNPDYEGFFRPTINLEICVDCGLCAKVCPQINIINKHPRAEKPFAAINKNSGILKKSSSGGVFSLLAEYILKKNGVVFGAVMKENNIVYHSIAHNSDELNPMRGSKYVQSVIGNTYSEVKKMLNSGKAVLFTGTPCQVAGLYTFLGNTNIAKLLTVDLVCHGTPSSKMFLSYLEKLASYKKIKYGEIKNFKFRQLHAWGITPSFQYRGDNILLEGEDNVYMQLFLSGRLFRPSCYKCLYTTPERVSDITIADFWGIGAEKKFQFDSSSGVSLLLLNSEKGKSVFNEIKDEMNFDSRDWSEALKRNHQLYRQSSRPHDRHKAIRSLFDQSIELTYKKFINTPCRRFRHYIGNILRRLQIRPLNN